MENKEDISIEKRNEKSLSYTDAAMYLYKYIGKINDIDFEYGIDYFYNIDFKEDDYWDYSFRYFNIVNLKKVIPKLYWKYNLTINNIEEIGYDLSKKINKRFFFCQQEFSDKYPKQKCNHLSTYYVKRSARFDEICNKQPEYKNLIKDIEKYYIDYFIDLNYMKRLFNHSSIVFNLINNYLYNEVLLFLIEKMKIDDAVEPIDLIDIDKEKLIEQLLDKNDIELFSSSVIKDLADNGELNIRPNYWLYFVWITNDRCYNYGLKVENIDNEYSKNETTEIIEYSQDEEFDKDLDTFFYF